MPEEVRMDYKIYIVSCTVCGRVLCKGCEMKHVEVQCKKCKNIFYVQVKDGILCMEECRNHCNATVVDTRVKHA